MTSSLLRLPLVVVLLLLAAPASSAIAGMQSQGPTVATADAAIPPPYKNCTQLNTKYPHGVGKVGARDKTTSGDSVTTFKRSTKVYNTAMSHNRGLDRDKDGVACEKE